MCDRRDGSSPKSMWAPFVKGGPEMETLQARAVSDDRQGQEWRTEWGFQQRIFFNKRSASFCIMASSSSSPSSPLAARLAPEVFIRPHLRQLAPYTPILPFRLSQSSCTTPRVRRHKVAAVAASAQKLAQEEVWEQLESNVDYLASNARLVQWYPGHIAKAEKELKSQIKLMDVIIEIRDARIPLATCHPEMDTWIRDKTRVVVLNRVDMISSPEKNAWANYFAFQGITILFTDGRRGSGIMKLGRAVKSVAKVVNDKRKAKGLLPRAVRAVVVGYPNVGKSSLINRLLKRKKCEAAPRPGVTRELKWARIGEDLDLLDAPGILPMKLCDQAAAIRLAICHDIGESSYAVAGVAAVFVEMLKRLPSAGAQVFQERYKIDANGMSGEVFLEELAQKLFAGDINQAASRLLQDYRKGGLGWVGLEWPPSNG